MANREKHRESKGQQKQLMVPFLLFSPSLSPSLSSHTHTHTRSVHARTCPSWIACGHDQSGKRRGSGGWTLTAANWKRGNNGKIVFWTPAGFDVLLCLFCVPFVLTLCLLCVPFVFVFLLCLLCVFLCLLCVYCVFLLCLRCVHFVIHLCWLCWLCVSFVFTLCFFCVYFVSPFVCFVYFVVVHRNYSSASLRRAVVRR